MQTLAKLSLGLGCVLLLLTGCTPDQQEPANKVEIKAAPKLTNDATSYAHAAWELMNHLDPIVYAGQTEEIVQQVRPELRKLSTDWRIHVKMTDSVTEGKYALCRKALTSLDVWARNVIEQDSQQPNKQSDYERDKKQCQQALAVPELGNTSPT
ncbi:hypothetical protein [Acinetobacter larvae]|uniref:Uncharacterized protein n=1 Tax=Acinetobacter larvae TaxID=1789224 RepID=A0A1B2M3W0_9GAMM|nr:hypothetical protein [Acinetobacter larvae]AOA59895.1 hypothetical protein BFG52_05950 [Acinetobacter larvae]